MKNQDEIVPKVIGLIVVFIFYFVFSNIAAPFGILCFPIFLGAIPFAVNNIFEKTAYYFKAITSILLLFISDILLRNYAGGTHDHAGNGWISLFFGIGFIAFIVSQSIVSLTKNQTEHQIKLKTIVVIISQIALFAIYFNYFSWYGMIRKIYTDSIEESKSHQIFLYEYDIIKNKSILSKDTIIFHEAWLENVAKIDHSNLIKKQYNTGRTKLRLAYNKSKGNIITPVEITDLTTLESHKSYSDFHSIEYERADIVNRDSILLLIHYMNICDSVYLVKKDALQQGI